MCDYSLTGVPNRLATAGEELITHRFPTGSMGLASTVDISKLEQMVAGQRLSLWEALKHWFAGPMVAEGVCAVCIPPGTTLQMSRIPESLRRRFALSALEEVTFTQLTAEPFHYRDAIRFRNGRHLLLQCLQEGVLFEVRTTGLEHTVSKVIDIGERMQNHLHGTAA
jgi:hypothetical protein